MNTNIAISPELEITEILKCVKPLTLDMEWEGNYADFITEDFNFGELSFDVLKVYGERSVTTSSYSSPSEIQTYKTVILEGVCFEGIEVSDEDYNAIHEAVQNAIEIQ